MFEDDHTWLSSRANLGEALTAIGVPDVADLELALPSSNGLVFKCNGLFYRFATNKQQARRMQREVLLLARIGPRLSVKVPEIIQSSRHPVFHAYKGIAGVGLERGDLSETEPVRRERVIASLARFMVELHQCEIGWCDSRDRDSGSRFAEVATRAALDHYGKVDPSGFARRFAVETAARYKATLPNRPTVVLLHEDLAASNILIDPLSGDVVGIIDFTEWRVGDHNLDFWFFRRIGGDDGLKTLARIYEAECGRRVDFDFVMAIERARLCRNLMRVGPSRQQPIDRMLELMKAWRPVA